MSFKFCKKLHQLQNVWCHEALRFESVKKNLAFCSDVTQRNMQKRTMQTTHLNKVLLQLARLILNLACSGDINLKSLLELL